MKLRPTEPTEPRWTVDGNDYNPDLHKKPTDNLETLMKELTERLEDTSQESKDKGGEKNRITTSSGT